MSCQLLRVRYSVEAHPSGVHLFKVNNGNTRIMIGICSKLTIQTSERSCWCVYSWLWIDFTYCSGILIVDFEQVNIGWKEKLFDWNVFTLSMYWRKFLWFENISPRKPISEWKVCNQNLFCEAIAGKAICIVCFWGNNCS